MSCDCLPLVMAMATDQAARAGDQGRGGGNRHNSLLAHNSASQYCGRFSNSGSLAMLMAMRRASSRVIRFAAGRWAIGITSPGWTALGRKRIAFPPRRTACATASEGIGWVNHQAAIVLLTTIALRRCAVSKTSNASSRNS